VPRVQKILLVNIKKHSFRIKISLRRHVSFLLQNVSLNTVGVILDKLLPFNFWNIERELLVIVVICKESLEDVCWRVVKDPLVIEEINKLFVDEIGELYLLLNLCGLFFHPFRTYDFCYD
jgi:hypothetical protein